jgi:hypothetical protein
MDKREPPINVIDLQMFFGCSGYYRCLIQNYDSFEYHIGAVPRMLAVV